MRRCYEHGRQSEKTSDRKRPQVARRVCLSISIQMWHRQQRELDAVLCRGDFLCDGHGWRTCARICMCVCARVCQRLLHLIAFVFLTCLVPSLGAGWLLETSAIETFPPQGPVGTTIACLESAGEQFLNQTEHCCTGYPW